MTTINPPADRIATPFVSGAAKTPPSADADKSRKSAIADDKAMLRAASELTRDLVNPSARVYWTDFLGSALLGYAGVAGAILAPTVPWMLAAALVAVLALYRAGSFIHELTHIRKNALPGFRLAWNALIGVPMLIPSFLYEGIHSLHHNRTKYGTVEDPEYLPLALMKPWTVPLFVVVAAIAPVALLFRFAVLTPLSFLIPPLRKLVMERYSGLIINPLFRRRPPEGEFRRIWAWQEGGAWAWSTLLIAAGVFGWVPLRALLIFGAIASASLVFNQIRTLVAHLWENDGGELTVTAQFLDSVNVPPPGLLPELWAPVGLRYHALHHLLPGVPYHALAEAHRRLKGALPVDSQYHGANYDGLPGLVVRLVQGSARGGAAV
ncbi:MULTISPECIES: fatty acid desaturase family protein [unclassified Sphingopyxis]|uniref:fatty acid desaturase family protein n=1 Tax=unclassified Sphingopyxis TaxID=2614943 RepID=UPI0009EB7B2E|nr:MULTISPECIES: fatty acid desaturase [unclassified Sphingopyxis]